MRDGRLTRDDRNALLAGDDRRGRRASCCATTTSRRWRSRSPSGAALEDLGFLQRLMQTLEQRRLLDRAVEFLPDDVELTERRRRGQPLTRPELAVLLAYAKLSLKDDLLDSTVPDDPYLGRELNRYFPPAVAERFPDAIDEPSAAARDHRDPARQLDDQPRRPDPGRADRRRDRRRPGRASRRRSRRCATATI